MLNYLVLKSHILAQVGNFQRNLENSVKLNLVKPPRVKKGKGIVHSFFSLLKSHILGYDGVWYSSFWSEGSRKFLN